MPRNTEGLNKRVKWVKGTSGNPKGRPPSKDLMDALKRVMTPEVCDQIVKALTKKAKAGDLAATKLIAERLHGLPVQHIQIPAVPTVVVEHTVLNVSKDEMLGDVSLDKQLDKQMTEQLADKNI